MAMNTQFSIAVHLMAGLGYLSEREATSTGLATSVNASPSFVRRIVSKLSKAGLVVTSTGQNGSTALARDPKEITLLDIYKAVEAPSVFSIHNYPEQKMCAVSCSIKSSMQNVLDKTQLSAESTLANIKLSEIIANV